MSTVEIVYEDDEHMRVLVNGKPEAYADHDNDGWAGMNAVATAARDIGRALGAEVIG